ncbi:MAG: hypothetical protein LBR58_02780 [Propionibacteriaceae bacterium]|jgi:putative FmdB family regulatory protein|nr:hypothetical protein [Propionibacteriaceae bacterium]
MPTYQYRCSSCQEESEVFQSFNDDPLTVCPACSGALRKIFSPVGVVFKGSGFYATDSRGSAKKTPKADTAAAESKPDTNQGAKPAAQAESKAEPKPSAAA